MAGRDDDFIDANNDWLEPRRRQAGSVDPGAAKSAGGQEAAPDYAVIWIPVFCPGCGTRDRNVYNSTAAQIGVRYHACGHCGLRFKSVEVIPDRVKKLRQRARTD